MPTENGHENGSSAAISELSLGDGGLVIYDPRNDQAWVQSDAPVRVRARA